MAQYVKEEEKRIVFNPPVVSNDEVDYMMKTMRRICDEAGFRSPGSEGEKKGHDIFEAEYKKFTDSVEQEKFKVAPGAYPGAMIKPIGWLYLVTVAAFFTVPILCGIILIPMVFWILELFCLKRAIDWAYPKMDSQNVIAKLKPTQETKTIIMFAGHNDSPNVFPITAKLRKKGEPIILGTFLIALLFALTGVIRGIRSIIAGQLYYPLRLDNMIIIDWMVVPGIIFVPLVMWITQTFVSKTKCLGANDNLSGAVIALALARYFFNHRPKNVELWFAAFGSEEAGQRGSTDFALKHKTELNQNDAYVINLESVGGGNFLLLATAETMCIPNIKHHPDVYNLLKEASRQVPIRRQVIRSELIQGYTDAEPFSRYGIKACSILGLMLDGFPLLWHIESDVPDSLHPGCMRDVMEIAIKAVELRDQEVSEITVAREVA